MGKDTILPARLTKVSPVKMQLVKVSSIPHSYIPCSGQGMYSPVTHSQVMQPAASYLKPSRHGTEQFTVTGQWAGGRVTNVGSASEGEIQGTICTGIIEGKAILLS